MSARTPLNSSLLRCRASAPSATVQCTGGLTTLSHSAARYDQSSLSSHARLRVCHVPSPRVAATGSPDRFHARVAVPKLMHEPHMCGNATAGDQYPTRYSHYTTTFYNVHDVHCQRRPVLATSNAHDVYCSRRPLVATSIAHDVKLSRRPAHNIHG